MERIFSSREIEKACVRDVNFRWLLQGQKVPFVMSFFIKISEIFHSTVKKEGVIKMINLIILIHPHFFL